MKYLPLICLYLLLTWVICSSSFAEANPTTEAEALKKQLELLQEQLMQLQHKIEALEKKDQEFEARQKIEVQTEEQLFLEKKKAKPVIAFWKNDFILSTADEEFWMKIRGNLHVDTKFYDSDSNNPTEFDIRRARFDFQGMFYHAIAFRVQAEFADSPYIRNAWVDYRFRPWLHLRGGQMKPPFSTSWWTTDNNVNFMERGAGTPLYPYFDRGWWLWGTLGEDTLTWNMSVWTGAGIEADEKKGDIDDHKDFIARLFWSPFLNHADSLFQGLHLVAQGAIGKQSVATKRFEKGGYSAAIRDDKFWTWNAEDAKIDSRDRFGLEMHYINGPFSFSTEYLTTYYDDIEMFADDGTQVIKDDGRVASWSTWVSWFLTGEQKSVSNFGWKTPSPKTNFNPQTFTGPGAWELLFRYTMTDTSNSLFNTYSYGGSGYSILVGADEVNEYTLGLNWTWNPLVRWQLNYVYLDGNNGGIQSGSSTNPAGTKRDDTDSMFGMRMIFKF